MSPRSWVWDQAVLPALDGLLSYGVAGRIARAAGLDAEELSRIRHGTRAPTRTTRRKLITALTSLTTAGFITEPSEDLLDAIERGPHLAGAARPLEPPRGGWESTAQRVQELRAQLGALGDPIASLAVWRELRAVCESVLPPWPFVPVPRHAGVPCGDWARGADPASLMVVLEALPAVYAIFPRQVAALAWARLWETLAAKRVDRARRLPTQETQHARDALIRARLAQVSTLYNVRDFGGAYHLVRKVEELLNQHDYADQRVRRLPDVYDYDLNLLPYTCRDFVRKLEAALGHYDAAADRAVTAGIWTPTTAEVSVAVSAGRPYVQAHVASGNPSRRLPPKCHQIVAALREHGRARPPLLRVRCLRTEALFLWRLGDHSTGDQVMRSAIQVAGAAGLLDQLKKIERQIVKTRGRAGDTPEALHLVAAGALLTLAESLLPGVNQTPRQ